MFCQKVKVTSNWSHEHEVVCCGVQWHLQSVTDLNPKEHHWDVVEWNIGTITEQQAHLQC